MITAIKDTMNIPCPAITKAIKSMTQQIIERLVSKLSFFDDFLAVLRVVIAVLAVKVRV
jgi:hypothetical protein